ncbi:hypothetical protein [Flavobacterium frigoris]|uniref:Uncharacterized protein n=1 Tax=Flavobacterium frigoris TaxID=229204 RepID=A0A1H9LK12_FLAFI|nr:hypothetical protein [Flavobacterium frigoris]SER11455.1 hypothetical protein SAMN05444355_10750 [Flavobacterium frigoris]
MSMKEVDLLVSQNIILKRGSEMDIKKTEYYIEINGNDNNGEFMIRIQKDCCQLQIETEDNDAYIDVSYAKLKTIRNTINEILEGYEKLNH